MCERLTTTASPTPHRYNLERLKSWTITNYCTAYKYIIPHFQHLR
nr:MAG TPA: hypothetical protein [Caudoviricetes sp.]